MISKTKGSEKIGSFFISFRFCSERNEIKDKIFRENRVTRLGFSTYINRKQFEQKKLFLLKTFFVYSIFFELFGFRKGIQMPSQQARSSDQAKDPRSLAGENRLLAALSEDEIARLLSELKPVRLKKRTLLYRAGDAVRYCYFPLSGMISLLSTAENGKSVIINIVGDDGLAGIAALLEPSITPYEVMAQIPVTALRVRADVLRKEFRRSGGFQVLVMHYFRRLLLHISQSAVCHSFHTVEQRLACWLLIASDRANTNEFSLTQQCLSQMLGVPRTSVSTAAHPLQQRGLISYKRGKIKLVDRRKLEQTACECYRIVKRESGDFD